MTGNYPSHISPMEWDLHDREMCDEPEFDPSEDDGGYSQSD